MKKEAPRKGRCGIAQLPSDEFRENSIFLKYRFFAFKCMLFTEAKIGESYFPSRSLLALSSETMNACRYSSPMQATRSIVRICLFAWINFCTPSSIHLATERKIYFCHTPIHRFIFPPCPKTLFFHLELLDSTETGRRETNIL